MQKASMKASFFTEESVYTMVHRDEEGRDTDTIMASVKDCSAKGACLAHPPPSVCVPSLPGDNRFPASLLNSLSLLSNPVLSQSIKGSLKLHSRDIQKKSDVFLP